MASRARLRLRPKRGFGLMIPPQAEAYRLLCGCAMPSAQHRYVVESIRAPEAAEAAVEAAEAAAEAAAAAAKAARAAAEVAEAAETAEAAEAAEAAEWALAEREALLERAAALWQRSGAAVWQATLDEAFGPPPPSVPISG